MYFGPDTPLSQLWLYCMDSNTTGSDMHYHTICIDFHNELAYKLFCFFHCSQTQKSRLRLKGLSETRDLQNQSLRRWTSFLILNLSPYNAELFCINHGDQKFFPTWNHHKSLSYLFLIHLNTYVIGLRLLEIFYSYSAVAVFIRHNLPSTDSRFWRVKTVPAPTGLRVHMSTSRGWKFQFN